MQTDGRRDGRASERTDGTGGQTGGQTDGRTDGWLYGPLDRLRDGLPYGRTDLRWSGVFLQIKELFSDNRQFPEKEISVIEIGFCDK